jgi:nitrogen-specific signal transduction histidine kinase
LVTEMAGLLGCKTSATAGTQFQILLPTEQQSDQPSNNKKGTP